MCIVSVAQLTNDMPHTEHKRENFLLGDITSKVGVMGCDNRFRGTVARVWNAMNKSLFVFSRRVTLTGWQDRGRVKTLSHHFSFYNARHTHVYVNRRLSLLSYFRPEPGHHQADDATKADKLPLFFDTWFMRRDAVTCEIYASLL